MRKYTNIFDNFGGLVLGCIEADFAIEYPFFWMFLRSTIFAHFWTSTFAHPLFLLFNFLTIYILSKL